MSRHVSKIQDMTFFLIFDAEMSWSLRHDILGPFWTCRDKDRWHLVCCLVSVKCECEITSKSLLHHHRQQSAHVYLYLQGHFWYHYPEPSSWCYNQLRCFENMSTEHEQTQQATSTSCSRQCSDGAWSFLIIGVSIDISLGEQESFRLNITTLVIWKI